MMLRALAVMLAVLVAGGALADTGAARIRLLDKNTNRVRDVTLVENSFSSNLPVQVVLRKCVRGVDGVPGQDVAWLDVSTLDGEGIFAGWMFNVYPEVAGLEHPRYDIRLLSCTTGGKAVAAPAAPAGGVVKQTDELHSLMDGVAQ
ncbi:MAG: DUF2155 domain-containing protein [Pseudomonadaceae bacterium]|nr:DUF2155 domain-containing protein [Pseudomonadaceae bacterium]